MNRLKSIFIILSSITIGLGSCNFIHKKDLSLTDKEYQKAGMPGYSKTWSRPDYLKALSALSSLKLYHPMSLPRADSRRSGKIFYSFINRENLSFVRDTSLSLAQRAFELQGFSNYQDNLRSVYFNKSRDEQYYNKELIDIYIFGLFVYKTMLDLALDILNSEDTEDISLQPGSLTVFISYNNLLTFVMKEQLKSKVYSSADLKRLSSEVSGSLISNHRWFQSVGADSINIRIENVIEKTSSDAVRDNYKKALAAFRN